MKRLIAALMICTSSVVFAQHRHPYGYATGSPQYHHHHHHHQRHHHAHDWRWVAPAIVSGAVVYAMTRPSLVVQQQPIVLQQPLVIEQPSDIVYIDGMAYRKQVMLVNGYYQEVLVRN